MILQIQVATELQLRRSGNSCELACEWRLWDYGFLFIFRSDAAIGVWSSNVKTNIPWYKIFIWALLIVTVTAPLNSGQKFQNLRFRLLNLDKFQKNSMR
jgi:hypothetical protein